MAEHDPDSPSLPPAAFSASMERTSESADDRPLNEAAPRVFGAPVVPERAWFGGARGDVLMDLRSAVLNGAGVLVLTGGTGTGKTVIARTLDALVRPNGVRVARLDYPCHDPEDFARAVREAYGWPAAGRDGFFSTAQAFFREAQARDLRALLILDEAHGVRADVLSEIMRLVTLAKEVGADAGSPFTVLLVGQDALTESLCSAQNVSLNALMDVRYRLDPLSDNDVPGYIEHRLLTAQLTRDTFTASAVEGIADISDGIPRVIDQLCDAALAEASRQAMPNVDRRIVEMAAANLFRVRRVRSSDGVEAGAHSTVQAPPTRPSRRPARDAIAAAVGCAAIIGFGLVLHLEPRPFSQPLVRPVSELVQKAVLLSDEMSSSVPAPARYASLSDAVRMPPARASVNGAGALSAAGTDADSGEADVLSPVPDGIPVTAMPGISDAATADVSRPAAPAPTASALSDNPGPTPRRSSVGRPRQSTRVRSRASTAAESAASDPEPSQGRRNDAPDPTSLMDWLLRDSTPSTRNADPATSRISPWRPADVHSSVRAHDKVEAGGPGRSKAGDAVQ